MTAATTPETRPRHQYGHMIQAQLQLGPAGKLCQPVGERNRHEKTQPILAADTAALAPAHSGRFPSSFSEAMYGTMPSIGTPTTSVPIARTAISATPIAHRPVPPRSRGAVESSGRSLSPPAANPAGFVLFKAGCAPGSSSSGPGSQRNSLPGRELPRYCRATARPKSLARRPHSSDSSSHRTYKLFPSRHENGELPPF